MVTGVLVGLARPVIALAPASAVQTKPSAAASPTGCAASYDGMVASDGLAWGETEPPEHALASAAARTQIRRIAAASQGRRSPGVNETGL
jgi:hypothetical protein